jgi:hypothetical protein
MVKCLKSIVRLAFFFPAALTLLEQTSLHAQQAGSVLFVRGADRSGGATEGSGVSDPFNIRGYTEQLVDIRDPAGPVFTNNSTGGGNHSWFELASLLTANGYSVEQTTESVEAGAGATSPTNGVAVTFGSGFQSATFADLNSNNGITQSRTLADYDVVVFGSNNAVYFPSQIDAVDAYIRGGGGAIFISDANFGSVRGDAQKSDQQFLDRFGVLVNEDRGTYQLNRGDGSGSFTEFRSPDSSILAGVDDFDGEGVSPFTLPSDLSTLPADVTAEIIAGVPAGQTIRGPGNNTRPATTSDAALLALEAGNGRIIGHFDRNTFFNLNGAGTNINRFDNAQLALNIFEFAAGPTLLGDVDMNGVVDFADIPAFIVVLQGGTFKAEADCDEDGDVDFDDIPEFVVILQGQ